MYWYMHPYIERKTGSSWLFFWVFGDNESLLLKLNYLSFTYWVTNWPIIKYKGLWVIDHYHTAYRPAHTQPTDHHLHTAYRPPPAHILPTCTQPTDKHHYTAYRPPLHSLPTTTTQPTDQHHTAYRPAHSPASCRVGQTPSPNSVPPPPSSRGCRCYRLDHGTQDHCTAVTRILLHYIT